MHLEEISAEPHHRALGQAQLTCGTGQGSKKVGGQLLVQGPSWSLQLLVCAPGLVPLLFVVHCKPRTVRMNIAGSARSGRDAAGA